MKIFKKLRTASLNSEFTGSYKKVYSFSNEKKLFQMLCHKLLKTGLNIAECGVALYC